MEKNVTFSLVCISRSEVFHSFYRSPPLMFVPLPCVYRDGDCTHSIGGWNEFLPWSMIISDELFELQPWAEWVIGYIVVIVKS